MCNEMSGKACFPCSRLIDCCAVQAWMSLSEGGR